MLYKHVAKTLPESQRQVENNLSRYLLALDNSYVRP